MCELALTFLTSLVPVSWGSECKSCTTLHGVGSVPQIKPAHSESTDWSVRYVHGTGHFVSLQSKKCATLQCFQYQPTTPSWNDIKVTQGHYMIIAVNMSWDTACQWGKLWRDRKWCLFFHLCKTGNEHLLLSEMKKIFLWLNGTLLLLLWFSTWSFFEREIINFQIIPAHRCVIYLPS